MKRSLLFITMLSLLSLSLVVPASATLTFYYYGGTLGEDWASFPQKLAPNLTGTPGSLEELSVTLPVYLVWRNENDIDVGEIPSGPIPITDLYFWDEHWDEVEFRVYHSDDFDDDFQECGDGFYVGLSLNSDGELTVTNEFFGGVGSNTRIELRWCFAGLEASCETEYMVAVQWDRPATYYDEVETANVDAYVGTTVVVEEEIVAGGDGSSLFDLYLPQMTVEWVSTDMRGTSAGYVDQADVAAFGAFYPSSVVWGFASDGGRDELSFHANFALWGGSADAIDSSDLTAIAADLSTSCGSSKAGEIDHAAAILAWFGIGKTGETVDVNGQSMPEYDVLDEEKFQNALGDPDGYLDTLSSSAVENVPWGDVKSLYR